jgi:hypothetical protein
VMTCKCDGPCNCKGEEGGAVTMGSFENQLTEKLGITSVPQRPRVALSAIEVAAEVQRALGIGGRQFEIALADRRAGAPLARIFSGAALRDRAIGFVGGQVLDEVSEAAQAEIKSFANKPPKDLALAAAVELEAFLADPNDQDGWKSLGRAGAFIEALLDRIAPTWTYRHVEKPDASVTMPDDPRETRMASELTEDERKTAWLMGMSQAEFVVAKGNAQQSVLASRIEAGPVRIPVAQLCTQAK